MKGYDVIIFDLDGTLADSKVGITKSILYALSKLGISEDNPDKLVDFIGPPLPESFKKYYGLDDLTARTAVAFYREYYAEKGIFETKILHEIPELLKLLYDNNKKLILATSKATIYSERIMQHFNIRKYFTLIIGSNFNLTMLCKSEIIKYVLSRITDYHKDKIIMVGDREDDIIAAHENGIDSIAVTYGYGSLEELEAVKPIYIVSSVEQLKSLLVKI